VRSGAGGSLGLGLYICKTVIEQHVGRVGVESVVGEGATA
jgi:signal transduction histidine kinase